MTIRPFSGHAIPEPLFRCSHPMTSTLTLLRLPPRASVSPRQPVYNRAQVFPASSARLHASKAIMTLLAPRRATITVPHALRAVGLQRRIGAEDPSHCSPSQRRLLPLHTHLPRRLLGDAASAHSYLHVVHTLRLFPHGKSGQPAQVTQLALIETSSPSPPRFKKRMAMQQCIPPSPFKFYWRLF
ncbi:hypothetical protein B0H19DRAFT_1261931 [Mycena capillaripes]|nr:hypothetical protein B0H19DRAFT_1261931 [Mycena capillaripes]